MKKNIVLIVYTCILTVLVGCLWVIVFDVNRAIFYLHEPEGRLTGATADGTVLAMLVSFGTLGLMAVALCIWAIYENRKPDKTLPAEEIYQSKFIIINEYMATFKNMTLPELTMKYVQLGFAPYDSFENEDYGKHQTLIAKTGYAGLVYDQAMRLFNYMKDVNSNPKVEKKDIKDTVIHNVHIDNGNVLIMTELEYFYGLCLYDRWIDSLSGYVMPDGSEF